MPRLHMFVEGVTEQIFASTLLVRHLAGFGVWLQKPVLVAHAQKEALPIAAVGGVSLRCRRT